MHYPESPKVSVWCVMGWMLGNIFVTENILGVVFVRPDGWFVAAGRVSSPTGE